MRNLLGGKGANLAEMANLGLPVPPGFTITTSLHLFLRQRQDLSGRTRRPRSRRRSSMSARSTGRAFGDAAEPAAGLRALGRPRLHARHDGHGAQPRPQRRRRSRRWRKNAGDERFAWDTYRRFIQMYSNVVLDVDASQFRGDPRGLQGPQGLLARHRPLRRRLEGDRRRLQEARRGARPASRSRRTRASSSGARSAPCSPPG